MDLYLLRHGIADEPKPGAPDSSRALTADGRAKLRAVLAQFSRGYQTPALFLSSPYKRALQTAELAARSLNYQGPILQTRALEPEGSPQSVWDEIRIHRSEPSLLLVGHNPLLSELTAFLLASPQLQVDFKKAGLLKIVVESFSAQPRGLLRWYLTPKLAGTDD